MDLGTLLKKDPHPLKKKAFFYLIMSGDFFGDMKNRKDNIRENWWDFILKFFMDFVENGLILLRDFFGLEGS